MTVASESSVLILGAGASAAFGLPLGGQLLLAVRAQINSELDSLKTDRQRGYSYDGQFGFWQQPVVSILRASNKFEREKLETLRNLLTNQTSETIDDFIVENPSFARLTKLALATILFKRCHTEPTRSDDSIFVRDFALRDLPSGRGSRRNWVHLFINVVRQGIRLGEVTTANKVQVVTFNYDCILEWVLDAQFSNTEAGYSDWRDYVEVTHVHGQFPPLPIANQVVVGAAPEIVRWAEGIHVVHEGSVPAAVAEARKKARDLVSSAREVYAAGFAFAGGNCRLLGLGEARQLSGRCLISYCNWNGDIGVRKSVEKLPRRTDQKVTIDEGQGTPAEPLEIESWIRAGYLGEMPA